MAMIPSLSNERQQRTKYKLSSKLLRAILIGLFALSLGLVVANYYVVVSQETHHGVMIENHGDGISLSSSFSSITYKINDEKNKYESHHKTSRATMQHTTTITIPYVISITSCDNSSSVVDGAAVLQHSIHLVHDKKNNHNHIKNGTAVSISSSSSSITDRRMATTIYDYQMYAIHLPTARACAIPLGEKLGFVLLEREVPVAVEEIQGDFLREHIQKNGCCGEKELIKLEAYTMTHAPIVVHVDIDAIILKPLDPVFDLMLLDNSTTTSHDSLSSSRGTGGVNFMWKDKPIPSKINAMFTLDYGMVGPRRKDKPVQGGFLILRPDLNAYNELVDIVRKGDFRERKGWGGKIGPFFGSMTIQGLLSYYYYVLHPNTSLELNRCVYNQMSERPRVGCDANTTASSATGKCFDGRDECEDCRLTDLSSIVSIHFTLCQKPWICISMHRNTILQKQCRKFHHEWFRIRSSLEESLGNNSTGIGDWQKEHFYGFCNRFGELGYLQLQLPD